jgi:hypothetical protein
MVNMMHTKYETEKFNGKNNFSFWERVIKRSFDLARSLQAFIEKGEETLEDER